MSPLSFKLLVEASGVGDFAEVVVLLRVQEDPDTEEEEEDPMEVAVFLGRGAFFAGVDSGLSDEQTTSAGFRNS
jgi:hypothetical protein